MINILKNKYSTINFTNGAEIAALINTLEIETNKLVKKEAFNEVMKLREETTWLKFYLIKLNNLKRD